MKHKCKICGTELPEKGAVCPDCGKELVSCTDVSCGLIGDKNKVKFKKCDVFLTENKLYIQDVHDRTAAGMLGVVGALAYSKQKKNFICEAPSQDLLKIEYPLKEKYGSVLDNVKGEGGFILFTKSGERFVVRPLTKKITAMTIDEFKGQGVVIE